MDILVVLMYHLKNMLMLLPFLGKEIFRGNDCTRLQRTALATYLLDDGGLAGRRFLDVLAGFVFFILSSMLLTSANTRATTTEGKHMVKNKQSQYKHGVLNS